MHWLRTVGVAIWIVVLVVITSWFVGLVAEQGVLVEAAALLPIFPILGMCWLRPREELAGWAVFTVWLGSTYIAGGAALELAGAAVVVLLAILGYFLSPWFLVLAWFGHIAWDFVPRELPALLVDLPTACLIFDGLIGAYLVVRLRTGRWSTNPDDGVAAQGAPGHG